MSVNDFLPFATDPDANVITQAEYAALAAEIDGFGAGRANSAQVNKAFRQASSIAAAVAGYVVAKAGTDVLDNGEIATITTNLTAAIAAQILGYGYAPLASPALTGNPTAPTQAGTDNSTKIATTAHVKAALTPFALLASPSFSGTPSASTAARGTNSGQLSTTAYVIDALSQYYTAAQVNSILTAYYTAAQINATFAPMASPTFSGTVSIPTRSAGDNSVAGANTAWVQNELAFTGESQQIGTGKMIIKAGGTIVIAPDSTGRVTYSTPFPNATLAPVVSYTNGSVADATRGNPFNVHLPDRFGFYIYNGGTNDAQYFWIAMGF